VASSKRLRWRVLGHVIISGPPTRFRAGVAQSVERQPSKLNVAGSRPVSRSISSIHAQNDTQPVLCDGLSGRGEPATTLSVRSLKVREASPGSIISSERSVLDGAAPFYRGSLVPPPLSVAQLTVIVTLNPSRKKGQMPEVQCGLPTALRTVVPGLLAS
jgi:hypothetical protein